jgi:hypothetical protein
LEEAEGYLRKGFDLTAHWEISHFFGLSTTLARVLIAQGNITEAIESMHRAENMQHNLTLPTWMILSLPVGCAQLKLLIGIWKEVEDWEKPHRPSEYQAGRKSGFLLYILFTGSRIAHLDTCWYCCIRKIRPGHRKPTELYKKSDSHHLDDLSIQYAVLLAIAYDKKSDRTTACHYLQKAPGYGCWRRSGAGIS